MKLTVKEAVGGDLSSLKISLLYVHTFVQSSAERLAGYLNAKVI